MGTDQNQDIKAPSELLKDLLARIEEYGKTSLNLYGLKALDIGSELLSLWMPRLIAAFFFLLSLIMLTIGSALLVGILLGKPIYGFFVAAAFYALVGLLLIIFKRPIKRILGNFLIRQVLK